MGKHLSRRNGLKNLVLVKKLTATEAPAAVNMVYNLVTLTSFGGLGWASTKEANAPRCIGEVTG